MGVSGNGADHLVIGARILCPCPAGLVVPALVDGHPVGAAVVHLYVRQNAQPLACPVCRGQGQLLLDPRKFATPNIGYTEPGHDQEQEEPAAPPGPRLVSP